jgi:hypothetical protein
MFTQFLTFKQNRFACKTLNKLTGECEHSRSVFSLSLSHSHILNEVIGSAIFPISSKIYLTLVFI